MWNLKLVNVTKGEQIHRETSGGDGRGGARRELEYLGLAERILINYVSISVFI